MSSYGGWGDDSVEQEVKNSEGRREARREGDISRERWRPAEVVGYLPCIWHLTVSLLHNAGSPQVSQQQCIYTGWPDAKEIQPQS